MQLVSSRRACPSQRVLESLSTLGRRGRRPRYRKVAWSVGLARGSYIGGSAPAHLASNMVVLHQRSSEAGQMDLNRGTGVSRSYAGARELRTVAGEKGGTLASGC